MNSILERKFKESKTSHTILIAIMPSSALLHELLQVDSREVSKGHPIRPAFVVRVEHRRIQDALVVQLQVKKIVLEISDIRQVRYSNQARSVEFNVITM